MHPGPFDMLHNTRNQHFLTISNCIHLDLLAQQVFVDQYRVFPLTFTASVKYCLKLCRVVNNLHCPSP
jgi:hypothetical protein